MAAEVEGTALSQTHEQLRQTTANRRVGKREGLDEAEACVDIGGVRDVAIDFLGGVVSGVSGIVVGQPFDTIKVRVQTQAIPVMAAAASAVDSQSLTHKQQPQVKGAMACAVETVSKEGVLALFKGMGTPLASAALVNAVSFGAYAQSQRMLAAYGFIEDDSHTADGDNGSGAYRQDGNSSGSDSNNSGDFSDRVLGGAGTGALSTKTGADRQQQQQRQQQQGQRQEEESSRRNAGFWWSFVGGSFAGLCQAAVIIPTDNIKIKLQIQVGAPGSDNLHYRGPVDCAMKLVQAQGVGSLFRGASVTALRDTPSIGLYFASYEGVKGFLERRWGLGQQVSSFCAGGLAGAASWFVIYPLDVVKSIQQASLDPLDPSTRSMTACFRHVYRAAGGGLQGVRPFFRGVSTTLLRAVPVNAAIFPTFEWTVKVLNRAFPSPR
ncbi:unnamed protein product [Scytosiphon promiscuus]